MLAMRNNTAYIKRDIMSEVIRMINEDTLEKEIDALPPRFYPRSGASVRCCVYKDRAMIRYRLLGVMGFSLEEDDDDTLLLRDYAKRALERTRKKQVKDLKPLTMLDMVCSSCAGGKYHVTDLCRGCVARPCQINCPRNAITIVNGRSVIDEDKCINCGKCQQLCPYNAIVYTPLPCSENCPVDAIILKEDGTRAIDYDKCISCGNCTRSCPFGAVVERSRIVDIAMALKGDKPVAALVAPALYGQFPYDPEKLNGAIRNIGFDRIVEVASGAEETARREALELGEKRAEGILPLTNSCCPAWKETVEKHIPGLQNNISHTPSPMAITGDLVKAKDPDVVTVFIGPCIAKKNEAAKLDCIDYTMTFEELGAFFLAREVEVANCDKTESQSAPDGPEAHKEGRTFARAGGVTEALISYLGEEADTVRLDGLDRKMIKQLKMHEKFFSGKDFIEVMCCEGGCLGGPGVISSPKPAAVRLEKYAKGEA